MKIRAGVYRRTDRVLLVASLVLAVTVQGASGLATTPEPEDAPAPPRLESSLATVVEIHSERGTSAALDHARREGIPVFGSSLIVQIASSNPGATSEAVVWLGGRVVTERRSVVEARVPIDRVGELTAEPSVGFVFVPPSPVPDSGRVESEGVSEAIESWHESGFDGSGIRVLVLASAAGALTASTAE